LPNAKVRRLSFFNVSLIIFFATVIGAEATNFFSAIIVVFLSIHCPNIRKLFVFVLYHRDLFNLILLFAMHDEKELAFSESNSPLKLIQEHLHFTEV